MNNFNCTYYAIIPAAGYSSRMQAFKPLLKWPPDFPRGISVIECAIRSMQMGGVKNIVVVLGYRAADVQEVISGYAVQIVTNDDPGAPMGSSVRLAMQIIPENAAVLLLPGDHPAVHPGTIRKLIAAHKSRSGAIHVPVTNGRRGHPTLFPEAARQGLLFPDPMLGPRALFDGRFEINEVDVSDPGIRKNLDFPRDYAISERVESADDTK